MINEIDRLHYCSGNYFKDGICSNSGFNELCELSCKVCRFYRIKFETVSDFETRTGQKISPYQAVYSRRSKNDSWRSEMYYMSQDKYAYCQELGTSEIVVACNDISPCLSDGRSVSAQEGVLFGDPVKTIHEKGWNEGYIHAAEDFNVIIKESGIDIENKQKIHELLAAFLKVKVKNSDKL